MKNNWQTKRLEDCLEKINYTKKVLSKKYRSYGKYPIISQENKLINGFWDEKEDLFHVTSPIIIFGDHTKILKYIDFDFVIGADGVKILKPKAFIDSKYFYYFLQSINLKSLGYARHYRLLLENSINYPQLPEQHRIVKIIDEAFEVIAKAKENIERNLQNSKELYESYLQSIFTFPNENWEICKIEDYIKFIDYRGKTPKKTLKGIPLITAKNIKMGFIQKYPEEFINPDNYESWMTRGIPKKGDILFTSEAPLANVAQLDTDEKVAFAQRIIILQPNQNIIDQRFLKYMLLSNPIRKKILDKGTGATVQGIKSSLLKKIEIFFPKNIEEQQSIVLKLDSLSTETKKLESIYKQKLANFEELKKSILQKAFNGEL